MMRRQFLLASLVSMVSGCASGMNLFSRGENFSVNFLSMVNRGLEDVAVSMPGNREAVWASQGMTPAHPPPRAFNVGDSNIGGDMYTADNNQLVPEEVEVSWRELPSPGGKPYTGELKGPYRVKVRSRIPPDVLRMARKEGYFVELMFSVGEWPILFGWDLVEFPSIASGRTGLELIRAGRKPIELVKRGGDSLRQVK
jgi:hypothetical protein